MDKLFLFLNAAVCGGAAVRIIMFEDAHHKHKFGYSALAWLLAVALFAIPVRTIFGVYNGSVDIAEFFLNCVLCAIVFAQGGNVAKVFQGGIGLWERIKKNGDHA